MRDAKSGKDVLKLERDNWQFGDYGLLCDGDIVYLSQQKVGWPRLQNIEIPKKLFDKLVDAYTGAQTAPKRNSK